MLAIRRLRRLHVTAAVTANGRFTGLGFPKVFPRKRGMAQRVAWLPRQAVTSVVTKQTGCRGAGTHEPVRKLVRTESDGAGHAGAGCEP